MQSGLSVAGGLSLKGMNFGQVDDAPGLMRPEDIIVNQELDPLITLFFGRRGDGKTLCMTAVMNIMLRAYIKHGKRFSERFPDGFKLATNYHVQFADFCDPHIVDMLSDMDDRYRRMCLGIDEILSYVPSRRTMARVNVNFATNFLVQLRKFDIELITTTQRPQNIDSQMLDQIDLFIMPVLFNKQWIPKQELWTHKYTGEMMYRATSCRLLIWDWWGTFTGKQYAKRWPPMLSGEQPDWIMDLHGLHQLFPWFSTKEAIPAMWHHKREDTLAKSWADALEEMVVEYAGEAIEEEKEGQKPVTIKDLVNAQPDEVVIHTLLDQAKAIDSSIKGTNDLKRIFDEAGFFLDKQSRKGWVAYRLEEK
jgi:hypothetical protein